MWGAKMTVTVTKESLAQWIAEMESQPHLSLKEERYLAIMKYAHTAATGFEQNEETKQRLFVERDKLLTANLRVSGRLKELEAKLISMLENE